MSRAGGIVPGDVPPAAAARRLGLTPARFDELLPALLRRGFPDPDATTGLFDLDAIEAWRRSRNPHLFGLTAASPAVDARTGLVETRLREFTGG